MTATQWLLLGLCAGLAILLAALTRRRSRQVRELLDSPPYRTANGLLIETQTRALQTSWQVELAELEEVERENAHKARRWLHRHRGRGGVLAFRRETAHSSRVPR